MRSPARGITAGAMLGASTEVGIPAYSICWTGGRSGRRSIRGSGGGQQVDRRFGMVTAAPVLTIHYHTGRRKLPGTIGPRHAYPPGPVLAVRGPVQPPGATANPTR